MSSNGFQKEVIPELSATGRMCHYCPSPNERRAEQPSTRGKTGYTGLAAEQPSTRGATGGNHSKKARYMDLAADRPSASLETISSTPTAKLLRGNIGHRYWKCGHRTTVGTLIGKTLEDVGHLVGKNVIDKLLEICCWLGAPWGTRRGGGSPATGGRALDRAH